jgi:hypothetical protein
MSKFQNLINKTQEACDNLGINVTNITVFRDSENGRHYLSGDYRLPSAFNGQVTRKTTTRIEEIFRGDEQLAFDMFMMGFSKNRVAYCNASDEEIAEFGMRHPDTYPVA